MDLEAQGTRIRKVLKTTIPAKLVDDEIIKDFEECMKKDVVNKLKSEGHQVFEDTLQSEVIKTLRFTDRKGHLIPLGNRTIQTFGSKTMVDIYASCEYIEKVKE